MDAGLAREIAAIATADPLLVAIDYDGTIAPLVPDPQQAIPNPHAMNAVLALATMSDTEVAIVTGRDADDLRAVAVELRGAPIRVVASHGADLAAPESSGPSTDHLVELLAGISDRFPGARVETKAHGAALHTRGLPSEHGDAALAAAVEAGRSAGAERVIRGSQVVELSMSSATKGDALLHLMNLVRPAATLFIGDDTTDEDAFGVLTGRPGVVTVRVGDGPTRAQHRAPDVDAVAVLLDTLLQLRRAALAGSTG